jgi:hypothetical protein
VLSSAAAGGLIGERYRPDLKAELRRQLTVLGAELLLGSPLRAEPPTAAGELGTFTVTTQAGAEVTADIWFRCYGVSRTPLTWCPPGRWPGSRAGT